LTPRPPRRVASRKSVWCHHVVAQPERYTGGRGRFHLGCRLA
jgi:hypothetical protein